MENEGQLFTILEVRQRLGIPKHTIRFWEIELAGLLNPSRTEGGQRRYTFRDVILLEQIKRLREGRMSLAGIATEIQRGEIKTLPPAQIDVLAYRVAEAVRHEVYNFFKTEKSAES